MDFSISTSSLVVFGAVTALALLAVWWFAAGDRRVSSRLSELEDAHTSILRRRRPTESRGWSLRSLLPAMGARLLPDSQAERERLHQQFIHAGIYAASAPSVFVAVRIVAALAFPALGLLAGLLGLVDSQHGLLAGGVAGAIGMLGPGYWLDWKTKKRQSQLRHSLPDFLDLVVTCLQSGMSFESSLQRVTDELRAAHPALATELLIVQREIDLGTRPELALRNFAERTDLEPARTLAAFVEQSRRFGSSIAESLRTLADMLRDQREQRAEEQAQKAAVKILFPTLLFIFPPILIVLAGPAAMELHEKFCNPQTESAAEDVS